MIDYIEDNRLQRIENEPNRNICPHEFDEKKFKSDIHHLCSLACAIQDKRSYFQGYLEELTASLTQVKALLGIDKVKQLLNEKHEEDRQNCAPLLVASKEGRADICDLLIYEYGVDIETEGTILFDGFIIEGATPLWCSAGSNHMTIVMMLIKVGADVNHATRSRSTPLRAACFDGKLEMVKLLLDHKADYNISNKFENTCLMIAVYKGHDDIVSCLLSHGAPPNVQALCGNSALQFAAEMGDMDMIKELLEYGADLHTVNKNGLTPLTSAAERAVDEAVDYFLSLKAYSREEEINALELLGASFANEKDAYDLERCYHYLRLALELRNQEPVLRKQLRPPIPAYDNRVECQTLEELEQIKYNAIALQMEGLTIRERILGSHNVEVPHQITYRGAVFADSHDFDRSVALWLHALSLREKTGTCLLRDLSRFAQVFCQMLHVGFPVPLDVLKRVMETTASLLELEMQKNTPLDCEDHTGIFSSVLYFVVIATKALLLDPQEDEELLDLIRRLCQNRYTTVDGNTLLHLVVDEKTPVSDYHTRNLCEFPCPYTTKLLIKCNANVNAVNKAGNTPLHVIMKFSNPISNFDAINSIMSELIRNGAHTDSVNAKGETPLETAATGVARTLLRFQLEIRLKCIAAKAVQKHGLRYKGIVPSGLVGFIESHGRQEEQLRVDQC